MTQEEKLEEAKRLYEIANADQKYVLERLFPSLKESEDERIRKYLYSFVELNSGVNLPPEDAKDMLAWLEKQGKDNMGITEATKQELEDNLNKTLEKETPESCNEFLEKQGEQRPTDKVEPKFHEGDWIINPQGTLRHIINVDEGGYQTDGGWLSHDTYEKTFHLWTLQDAKDGDVLADGNLPFIFKKIDNNKYSYAYCGISVDDGFKIESDGGSGEWTWMQDIKPATKEQRDLLFQKMHEAGYEWDADTHELKKIEQNASSEEDDDDAWLNDIISKAECNLQLNKGEIDWLKSLKDRVQPHWKPSDMELEVLRLAAEKDGICLMKLYEQLKKLRDE